LLPGLPAACASARLTVPPPRLLEGNAPRWTRDSQPGPKTTALVQWPNRSLPATMTDPLRSQPSMKT
jgi:hypothetical protein